MPADKARGCLLIGILFVALNLVVSRVEAGETDFLIYWSATHLLATRGNPFDLGSLRSLELETRPERWQDERHTLAAWNPPWLFVLLLPLGLLPFDLAAHIWMICNICLIGAAAALTWQKLVGTIDRRSMVIPLALGLYFGPSLVTIEMGQISVLLLIGLVMTVHWLHAGRDKLAGVTLLLTTIKPQATYFVLLLIILWAIHHRRWQVFGGMAAALILSAIVLWIIFPNWVSAYFRLVSSHAFFQYSTSTLGGLAYALWGTNLLRFAGILLLPFTPFLLRMVDSRGWLTALNAALLVSVPLAPYGFTFDYLVLLPTVLQIAAWLWHRELPVRWVYKIGGGLVLLYVVLFAMLTTDLYYHYFTWVPLALAGLYALAWRKRRPVSCKGAVYHSRESA